MAMLCWRRRTARGMLGRALAAWVVVALAASRVEAMDLTGSWWIHPDPVVGGPPSSGADVTLGITQSDGALSILDVTPTQFAATPGQGEGTVDVDTGAVHAFYGYTSAFEPLVAELSAVASPDGSTLYGTVSIRVGFDSAPVFSGNVIGVRSTGAPAVCGNGALELGEQCDDGNTSDADCCSTTCRLVSRVCRAAASRCDVAETCVAGACPPDGGLGDADADGICNADDACHDPTGSHRFQPGSMTTLTRLDNGRDDDERLRVRAVFDLPPDLPFASYDPTTTITMIRLTLSGGRILDAALPPDAYSGPGTRGWTRDTSGTGWRWRDHTTAPIEDLEDVRIGMRPRAGAERIRVRIAGRGHPGASGLPHAISPGHLPLELSVTLGSYSDGQTGRCGQSRIRPTDCRFSSGATRLTCAQGP